MSKINARCKYKDDEECETGDCIVRIKQDGKWIFFKCSHLIYPFPMGVHNTGGYYDE